MQALRFGELWGGMSSLADRQARTPRRFHALRVVRLGELWRGVPPFAHKQAPPRAGRRQVHLVRIKVDRRRLPSQPDREACEVGLTAKAPRTDGSEWQMVTEENKASGSRSCCRRLRRARWSRPTKIDMLEIAARWGQLAPPGVEVLPLPAVP